MTIIGLRALKIWGKGLGKVLKKGCPKKKFGTPIYQIIELLTINVEIGFSRINKENINRVPIAFSESHFIFWFKQIFYNQ